MVRRTILLHFSDSPTSHKLWQRRQWRLWPRHKLSNQTTLLLPPVAKESSLTLNSIESPRQQRMHRLYLAALLAVPLALALSHTHSQALLRPPRKLKNRWRRRSLTCAEESAGKVGERATASGKAAQLASIQFLGPQLADSAVTWTVKPCHRLPVAAGRASRGERMRAQAT